MFRNPMIPKMIVMYPVMVLLVFPWAVSFEIKNIKIDVVDHSKNVYSKRLTDKIGPHQLAVKQILLQKRQSTKKLGQLLPINSLLPQQQKLQFSP